MFKLGLVIPAHLKDTAIVQGLRAFCGILKGYKGKYFEKTQLHRLTAKVGLMTPVPLAGDTNGDLKVNFEDEPFKGNWLNDQNYYPPESE